MVVGGGGGTFACLFVCGVCASVSVVWSINQESIVNFYQFLLNFNFIEYFSRILAPCIDNCELNKLCVEE